MAVAFSSVAALAWLAALLIIGTTTTYAQSKYSERFQQSASSGACLRVDGGAPVRVAIAAAASTGSDAPSQLQLYIHNTYTALVMLIYPSFCRTHPTAVFA